MPFRRVQHCFLLLLTLFPVACRRPVQAPPERSFYYWKTTGEAHPEADNKLMRRLYVGHFYLHFMDVDWSENLKIPVPRFEANGLQRYAANSFTPVVFISNRVFDRMTDAWTDTLAGRLEQKLTAFVQGLDEQLFSSYYWKLPDSVRQRTNRDSIENAFYSGRKQFWKEVQIDCDWTPDTRERYFRFLRQFKARFRGKMVSVTVRLYPYKYPNKMGVPPVDRGLLMCYNMDNIRQAATENSVFDLKTLQSYLGGKKYPLPLDAALPIFSWSAVFRGSEYKGILYGPDSALLHNPTVFTEAGGNRFRLLRDTVVESMYLREGDILRLESPDAGGLREAAALLHSELPRMQRLAYYHWNYQDVLRYETTIAESWGRR